MIHVLAVITAKPGLREQVLVHLRNNIAAVKAEQGCIEYGPATDIGDGPATQTKYGDDTFVVIEKWASMADLNAHAIAPHLRAYAAAVKDLVANRQVYMLRDA